MTPISPIHSLAFKKYSQSSDKTNNFIYFKDYLMKAVDAHLLTFLEGKKQFQIPIYQRTYSWGHKQCEKLLHDILIASTNAEAHFVGSVVYFQPEIVTATGVPRYLVIDGQQRLTTVTILLTAIRDFLKKIQV
jgi:uncharacterized protein with ParB-like and HNH nuclease domain